MKNTKLFKSLSAIVLAGMMVCSNISFVSAEKTQVTDKSSFEMVFKNEVGVKYLSEKDSIAVVEAIHDKPISEISGLSMGKYSTVHIVDDNTVFSIDWAKSTFSEKDVKSMYISTYLWYKDDNGKFKYALCYNDVTEDTETLYRLAEDPTLKLNAKGEYNIRDNFGYSLDKFIADGGDEDIIDAVYDGEVDINDVVGLGLLANWYLGVGINSTIGDPMNSTDTSSWKSPQAFSTAVGGGCYSLESFFDNNMFLACVCIEYTNPETGDVRTAWEYIASKSAMTNANNPFTYLDEKPSDSPAAGDSGNKPSTDDNDNNPSSGDNGNNPSTDDNGNKPSTDNNGNKPSTDNNGNKPSTDNKEDESSTDNNEEATTPEEPTTENNATTEVKEVTLTTDNTVVSKDDMDGFIAENATKDVVIKTPSGITLTFVKGTMNAVDGKDAYDFGVSMSDDYSKHADMGVVTKSNFVSLIDFNYSGNLPAEATIKIPVGIDRAGQTLYYSQKVAAGYTLVQSVKVDAEGYITVKQDHCSTYVVTTEDISDDNSSNTQDDLKKTPDSNNVLVYVIIAVVILAVVGAGIAVFVVYKKKKTEQQDN